MHARRIDRQRQHFGEQCTGLWYLRSLEWANLRLHPVIGPFKKGLFGACVITEYEDQGEGLWPIQTAAQSLPG
jgi:hypothetical protein